MRVPGGGHHGPNPYWKVASREEYTTGQPTKNTFHLQAARERISWLNRIMREQNLNAVDRATAEAMRDDLQRAVDLYKLKPKP